MRTQQNSFIAAAQTEAVNVTLGNANMPHICRALPREKDTSLMYTRYSFIIHISIRINTVDILN